MSQLHKPGLLTRARRMATRYGVTGGKVAAGLLCVVLVCAAALGIWLQESNPGVVVERSSASATSDFDGSAGETAQSASKVTSEVVVHVDGAVASPGVFSLAEGSRVNDAVLAAGGLDESADTSTVNLAAPLSDGAKVHIPTTEELASTTTGAAEPGGQSGSGTASNGLVNINTATSAELQTLSGVGEATAQAIIEDRESNGPFTSPEDLMRVSGIGEKKFAKVKEHICV